MGIKRKHGIMMHGMKRTLLLAWIFLAGIVLAGCHKDKEKPGKPDEPVAVEGVSVSPSSLSLAQGRTVALTAEIKPSNAENKSVTWASSDESVAAVDQDGLVTAVSPGSATVTVTTVDGGKTAVCRVSVGQLAATGDAINITPYSATLPCIANQTVEGMSAAVQYSKSEAMEPSSVTEIPAVFAPDDTFDVTLSGLTPLTTYYFRAVVRVGSVTSYGNIKSFTTTTVAVTGIELDKAKLRIVVGEEVTLTASVKPADAVDKSVSWTSSSPEVASVSDGKVKAVSVGKTIVTVKTTDGGFTAACEVTVMSVKPEKAVDLGLSVYWGSENLGVNFYEPSGRYYAWGETAPKSTYNEETYALSDGDMSSLKKYNASDKLTRLEPEEDAAVKALGGSWRIPTAAEWQELLDNCDWKWSDSKKGYTVTSKVPGFEGNNIFLPAAGCRLNTNYYYPDSFGYYWSSELDPERPEVAMNLYFTTNSCVLRGEYRYYGYSIRPVSD